jgi:predicted nucleotidyltransferase
MGPPARDTVLDLLSHRREEIRERFGVSSLALFGSLARREAVTTSDVDILVGFQNPPGFDGYMALKWYLEDLLGSPVDLVMEGALRPEVRRIVAAEAVSVA